VTRRLSYDDLTEEERAYVDAERYAFRQVVALVILFIALCICAAYIIGGSYPESLPCDPAACEVDE
jgi:hypothetical protein